MYWTILLLCVVVGVPAVAPIIYLYLKDKKERNANETYLNNYNELIKSLEEAKFETSRTLIITDEWSIGAPVEYKKHIFLDEKAKKMDRVGNCTDDVSRRSRRRDDDKGR